MDDLFADEHQECRECGKIYNLVGWGRICFKCKELREKDKTPEPVS